MSKIDCRSFASFPPFLLFWSSLPHSFLNIKVCIFFNFVYFCLSPFFLSSFFLFFFSLNLHLITLSIYYWFMAQVNQSRIISSTFNDIVLTPSLKKDKSRRKKYQCDYCPKDFTRPSALQTHVYTHTGEKPHECDM